MTVETYAYDEPTFNRSGAVKTTKTGYKTYTLSNSGDGDILIVKLDATFEIHTDDSVTCPRYYSSYEVLNSAAVVSYKETNMDYTKYERGARVKTTYEIKYKKNPITTVTKTPSLSVSCNSNGEIL